MTKETTRWLGIEARRRVERLNRMPSFSKKSSASGVSLSVVLALLGLGASSVFAGCSSSSNAPAASSDASTDGQAGPPSPLGVPVSSCAGCTVCGGVLGSPTTGITYCTADCTTDTDCPSGTGCTASPSSSTLSNECLKTCTSNTDCTSPFVCRSDLPAPGSFCWSPYPPPSDAGPDAAPDAGAVTTVDAGDAGSAATVDAGDDAGLDAGLSDASVDAASE
jgi:hypothetical protein